MKWALKMAWRDARRNKLKLVLFGTSIIMGVAALVSINSFSNNLETEINRQGKDLAGADLQVSDKKPFSDSLLNILDTLGVARSREVYFASMVYFPESQSTRLVQVRALEEGFPFYGTFMTSPQGARSRLNESGNALVDNTLLIQFDSEPGDSVRVGEKTFKIEAAVNQVPGRSQVSTTIAPPVYIPWQDLEETGLMQKGSRVTYIYYFKFATQDKLESAVEYLDPVLEKFGVDYDTVEEVRNDTTRTFEDLNKYLKLIAFVALIIGAVGVGSAVNLYIREKIPSVAVLGCLGASRWNAFSVYLIQISLLAIGGALAGGILGIGVQLLLPEIFSSFLPLEVELTISWSALLGGMGTGFLIAFLFTLIPLLRIRNVSPLQVLRLGEPGNLRTGSLQYVLYALIVLVLFGLSYLQIREFLQAFYFTLFLVFSFVILGAISLLMMKLLRKVFPHSWSYVIRQGLANLYRPNNQTVTLLITIGLGTALLATLFLTQRILLDRVAYSGQEDRPNMVIFDIQNEQKEEVLDFVRKQELPVLQNVPVVTMRLQAVNGKSRQEIKEDTTSKIRDWTLDREYRVTYRDTLIDSETLISGEFTRPVTSRQDSVFISLEEDYAGDLGLEIGDQLTFNVQGIPVTTYLGSTRQIDWRRVQTNFLVVFPSGVLEKAPQFHVLVTRVESDSASAAVQRQLVNRFPNVSVIDLQLILTTLEQVLEKAAFVIRFMAIFSMVTGLIVLVVSLIVSRYNRILESALLRTLGAQKRQVIYINAVEYATLGALASSSGILLSLLASFLLAVYNFEGQFFPSLGPVLITVLVVTLACGILGIFNIRGIIRQTPLEILRKEV